MSSGPEKINLAEAFLGIHDRWKPRIAADLNGQQVKLVKFLGPFVWHHHDHEDELFLVVRGSFRYVRNPAYLAAVVSLVGQGLWFASSGLLIYALILWIIFHLFVIGYEEPTLRNKFGAEYESYCREVPRWVPRRVVRS